MPKTNKFITFEGGEGAGKSTQIKALAKYLEEKGEQVVITREPGGTKNAEEIRSLLVNGATNKWDGFTEVLLNFAARNEHVKNVIQPALEQGKWVLCDRFFDSTTVYQGYGQGQDLEKINLIRRAVLGDFAPDKTFLLDIDVRTGLKRARDANRYEKMGAAFHDKIRVGFIEIAKKEPNRFVIIDASQPKHKVEKEIIAKLG